MSLYRPWRHGTDGCAETSRHVPTLRYGRPQSAYKDHHHYYHNNSCSNDQLDEVNFPRRHAPSLTHSSSGSSSSNTSHTPYMPTAVRYVKSHRTSSSSSSSSSSSASSSTSTSSSSSFASASDGAVRSAEGRLIRAPDAQHNTSKAVEKEEEEEEDDDLDADSVIPPRMHRPHGFGAELWRRQPSHRVVLSLLQHRGVYLPRYRTVIDYHMAALFLHYLDICRVGAYFVHYEADRWPRERFFRLRMLPLDRVSAGDTPVPHLVCTLHDTAVDIIRAVPLQDLIGVTAGTAAPNFRPFCISAEIIFGCRQGRGHRARLPTNGCFTLWFRDRAKTATAGIGREAHLLPCTTMDLLTCDGRVFEIWTHALRGLVSVNSTTVVELPLTARRANNNNNNNDTNSGAGRQAAAHTTTTAAAAAAASAA